jgi:hypothetical protein
LLGESASDMVRSWDESPGWADPLTLCAGVGKVVVIDIMELFMLDNGSAVLGEN